MLSAVSTAAAFQKQFEQMWEAGMANEKLRNLWLNSTVPYLPCKMADGKIALLILGPTDSQVREGIWRFGFQVSGEENIRWLTADRISLIDGRLYEHSELPDAS